MNNFRALIVPKSGETVKLKTKAQEFEWNKGRYNAPKNNQINTLKTTWGRQRYAIYSEGVPEPWDIAGEKRKPGAYTAEDVLTVKGKYLSNVVRDALADEAKTETLLFITIVISGISLLISAASTYLIYKVAKLAGVI